MRTIEFELLPHQYEFVSDVDTRYLGLVAGYGAGKTFSFVCKGIYLAYLNVGHKGALLEPTHSMAKDILIPTLTDLLNFYEIPFNYTAAPYPNFHLHFDEGSSTILIRSAENYKRLAGLNLAWFGVDEADTIKKDVAHRMWKLLQSRLRSKADHIQGFTTSTPEGFNFLYEYFVQQPDEDPTLKQERRVIHASTYENRRNLAPGYIESLLKEYPKNLIEGYLNGQFTNLLTGNVYVNYDRDENNTDKTVDDFNVTNENGEVIQYAPLHIGVDFNVNKCCAIIHCIDDKNRPYAVDEITGERNTETLIKAIKKRFPNHDNITIYPDSSGKSEKTNASVTDIKLLKQHFKVMVNNKNPPVRDRVNSMNAMFRNGEGERRYFVNKTKCKVYVEALTTQGYDDNGNPDKAHDQDHPVDAGGYFIYKRYPLRHRHKPVKIVGV